MNTRMQKTKQIMARKCYKNLNNATKLKKQHLYIPYLYNIWQKKMMKKNYESNSDCHYNL